jgi:hypothetical protein
MNPVDIYEEGTKERKEHRHPKLKVEEEEKSKSQV